MCAKSFISALCSHMDDPIRSYMNEIKKNFLFEELQPKKFWVFFRSITSNPSKLQQNLISRRVVDINGLMYMASKDWKISTFLHHRCILSLLQYGNSIIALHFIVMVNHCALPGKHLRKIRKMYFPNWFQNWFLKTYLKPFRKKGFRGHD